MEEGVAGDYDVAAAGEWAADGLEGLATHDDGVAFGRGLEVLEVGAEVPGHLAVEADGVVLGGCYDDVHANKKGSKRGVKRE